MVQIVSCHCSPDQPTTAPRHEFADASISRQPGILDADIMGYYPLGPSLGTDISGRGHHATPAIDPVALRKGMMCELAEVLDGRQSWKLPFRLDNSITISMFHRTALSRLESTFLSLGPNVRFGLTFQLQPIVSIYRGTDQETHVTGPTLRDATWYHIAFATSSAGQIKIYVDGVSVALRLNGVPQSRVRVPIVPAADRAAPMLSRHNETGYQDRQRSGLHGALQDVLIRTAYVTAAEIALERQSYCEAVFEVSP